jgi:dihydroorotate dehydrogenase (NAD+) catalytic subunit
MVHRVYREVDLPIIGMGGIASATDALEFMVAGSAAVQVGTLNFVEPAGPARLVRDLAAWCRTRRIGAVRDLVGTLALPGKHGCDAPAG